MSSGASAPSVRAKVPGGRSPSQIAHGDLQAQSAPGLVAGTSALSGADTRQACPPCFAWVISAWQASLGPFDAATRAALLREVPETERALIDTSPPDAPLFEWTRQCARAFANTSDPVARDRYACVIRALYDQCLDALRTADDAAYRRRREGELLNARRRENTGG
ncbi:MAG: hypothetical protein ACXIVO_13815 [Glycocaulis sp.]